MRQISFRKVAIAASACTCAVLLSWNWSEQNGVSLSVDSAQAAVGRPLTPVSVAGASRRAARRAGTGAGVPYYGGGRGYYGGGSYAGGWYRDWDHYALVNGIKCRPGSWIKMPDGETYLCQ